MNINPGELNKKIKVLSINKTNDTYAWVADTTTWAKVEVTTKNNIFSNVGYGTKLVNFVMRKRNLTLHNAFKWNDKHCFITDIKELNRLYYEVTAALIEPKICSVERTSESILDELNRPIYNDETNTIIFPACMTEKYVRQTQEQPMSTIESCYVLVTPKVIELINGELVTMNEIAYEVLVSHNLDDYKNEYEIRVRKES